MKRILLLFLLTVYPVAASSADDAQTSQNRPHWSFELKGGLFYPSIGNWQFPCKSHYWISGGEIRWAEEWTPEQIEAGREAEDQRRRRYYRERDRQQIGILKRFWRWLISFFR